MKEKRTEVRKVYLSGGSSYIVTLPKWWVKSNGLKPGSSVILQVENNSILIMPKAPTKAKISATIDGTNLKSSALSRMIIAYYLAGYDTLNVVVSNEEQKRAVVETVDCLISADIFEESKNNIKIEIFHFDDKRFDIEHILESISHMCVSIFSDFCSLLGEFDETTCNFVLLREREVDKLHFLALRQINLLGLNGQRIPTLFAYWSVARRFERISDHIEKSVKNLLKIRRSLPELEGVARKVLEVLKWSRTAFCRRDTELAESVIEKSNRIQDDMENIYSKMTEYSTEVALPMAFILDSLARIVAYSIDIAEVTINLSVFDTSSS